MNTNELIDQLHTLNLETLLYCFPVDDDTAQLLADEFPFIKIIQELGCWTPPGTRTQISIALGQKFDIVVIPDKLVKELFSAGIVCTKKGGYLFSDKKINVRGMGLKTGIEMNGIYRYLKK